MHTGNRFPFRVRLNPGVACVAVVAAVAAVVAAAAIAANAISASPPTS